MVVWTSSMIQLVLAIIKFVLAPLEVGLEFAFNLEVSGERLVVNYIM
jgi:hypothetical protein